MPVEVCSPYVPFFDSPTPHLPPLSVACPRLSAPPPPNITGGLYRPTTFLLPPALCVPLSFWPCPRVVSPISRFPHFCVS